jgi:hypothetical protein
MKELNGVEILKWDSLPADAFKAIYITSNPKINITAKLYAGTMDWFCKSARIHAIVQLKIPLDKKNLQGLSHAFTFITFRFEKIDRIPDKPAAKKFNPPK